jgi:hypothetical protein
LFAFDFSEGQFDDVAHVKPELLNDKIIIAVENLIPEALLDVGKIQNRVLNKLRALVDEISQLKSVQFNKSTAVQFQHNKVKVSVVFDSLGFFQSGNDFKGVMIKDFVVDLDMFLVAAQKVQLPYLHVQAFLFSQHFYD